MNTLIRLSDVSLSLFMTLLGLWLLAVSAPLILQVIVAPLLGFGFARTLSRGPHDDKKSG